MADSSGDRGPAAAPTTSVTTTAGVIGAGVIDPHDNEPRAPSLKHVLTIWKHVDGDESISLFDHSRIPPPKFLGMFKVSYKLRLSIEALLKFLILIEIVVELCLLLLFLFEFFTETYERTTVGNVIGLSPRRVLRHPWGFKSCPSANSSLLQASLCLLTAAFATLLILGKSKENVHFIRCWLMAVLLTTVGRLTVAAVWFRCIFNLPIIVWALGQLLFLELVRFYHWQVETTGEFMLLRTSTRSATALKTEETVADPDEHGTQRPVPAILITPPPE